MEYKSEVELLKHQYAQLQRMLFGKKSERFVLHDPNQGVLFDLPKEEIAEKKTEEITYTRNITKKEKKHPLRTPLPAHLPRKEEVIEPDNIPENARRIGETITEILEYTPANIYVRKIIRPKYIVDSNDERTQIAIAPMPLLPIPKGNAGASMIAYILVSKFVDHLPYSRIAKIFKRQNLYTADSTLGGWANNAISNLLILAYEQIQKEIVKTDYLMADETPIAVLTEDKPGATHQGYLWVYYDPVRKMVLFDYQKSRGREGPKFILKDFSGFVQSDGYVAYDKLGSLIKFLACMAHARRKFDKAMDNDPERAQKILILIQKLYDVERKAREADLGFDEIKILRQEKSVPV
ncbi:MAG: IS66 family transposase, partial [Bacteroidales bacterium]|nr:IS66 family transposase [Bacteroidales bacterium]